MKLTAISKKAAVYGVRHLLQRADYHLGLGLSRPDKVTLFLTHRCNCRCRMCDRWKEEDHSGELPASRWIGILDELHDWLGTSRVVFSGGEVFLKPGVYDIIQRAVELGLTADVISNGLVFKSESHFRNLLSTGLKSICFSIDGMDPAVHDRNRGTPGLHATVTEVIRRIKREKPSMSIEVICIIMRETAPHLEEFARWAEELGVDNVMFQPILQTIGDPARRVDWYRDSDLFVTDLESLDRSICGLLEWNARSGRLQMSESSLRKMQRYFAGPEKVQMKGRRCMLGQTDLRIDPAGVVYMCGVRHTAIGHVDDGPLRKTWRGSRARAARGWIRHCRRPCAALCHRSPGLLEKARRFLRFAREGKL
jgi:MoaA/NifB/PqqE/SkfB family radical SAM enzyme